MSCSTISSSARLVEIIDNSLETEQANNARSLTVFLRITYQTKVHLRTYYSLSFSQTIPRATLQVVRRMIQR
jgi:hypothetical protein